MSSFEACIYVFLKLILVTGGNCFQLIPVRAFFREEYLLFRHCLELLVYGNTIKQTLVGFLLVLKSCAWSVASCDLLSLPSHGDVKEKIEQLDTQGKAPKTGFIQGHCKRDRDCRTGCSPIPDTAKTAGDLWLVSRVRGQWVENH